MNDKMNDKMSDRIEYIKKMSDGTHLLYVEDNEGLRKNMQALLERISSNVIIAKDGEEGYDKFIKYKPQIVITDLNMPEVSGFEMIKAIMPLQENCKIIILSAYNEPQNLYKAIEFGVFRYLHKPAKAIDLVAAIYAAFKAIDKDTMQREFYNQLKTIVNYETNLVAMIQQNSVIFSNQRFLDFFGVSDLDNFHEKYKNIDSLLLKHNNFLYTGSLGRSWVKEISLHPGKLYNALMVNATNKRRHFILKSNTVEDIDDCVVVSFDDVTDLNLLQCFDKQKKERAEVIDDKKTIISFIKIVKENGAELKIHNFYKGLTIVNKAEIVDFSEDEVKLKTAHAQLRVIKLTNFTTMSSPIFPKNIVCKSIKKIDFDEQTLVVDDMVFASRSAVDRKYIRLVPEENYTCALFYKNIAIETEMKIFDVSEVSARLELATLPFGLKVDDVVKLSMGLTLHSKPFSIVTQAQIYRIDKNQNSSFVVVMFDLEPNQLLTLKEYLANRQMALIREFKKMDAI